MAKRVAVYRGGLAHLAEQLAARLMVEGYETTLDRESGGEALVLGLFPSSSGGRIRYRASDSPATQDAVRAIASATHWRAMAMFVPPIRDRNAVGSSQAPVVRAEIPTRLPMNEAIEVIVASLNRMLVSQLGVAQTSTPGQPGRSAPVMGAWTRAKAVAQAHTALIDETEGRLAQPVPALEAADGEAAPDGARACARASETTCAAAESATSAPAGGGIEPARAAERFDASAVGAQVHGVPGTDDRASAVVGPGGALGGTAAEAEGVGGSDADVGKVDQRTGEVDRFATGTMAAVPGVESARAAVGVEEPSAIGGRPHEGDAANPRTITAVAGVESVSAAGVTRVEEPSAMGPPRPRPLVVVHTATGPVEKEPSTRTLPPGFGPFGICRDRGTAPAEAEGQVAAPLPSETEEAASIPATSQPDDTAPVPAAAAGSEDGSERVTTHVVSTRDDHADPAAADPVDATADDRSPVAPQPATRTNADPTLGDAESPVAFEGDAAATSAAAEPQAEDPEPEAAPEPPARSARAQASTVPHEGDPEPMKSAARSRGENGPLAKTFVPALRPARAVRIADPSAWGRVWMAAPGARPEAGHPFRRHASLPGGGLSSVNPMRELNPALGSAGRASDRTPQPPMASWTGSRPWIPPATTVPAPLPAVAPPDGDESNGAAAATGVPTARDAAPATGAPTPARAAPATDAALATSTADVAPVITAAPTQPANPSATPLHDAQTPAFPWAPAPPPAGLGFGRRGDPRGIRFPSMWPSRSSSGTAPPATRPVSPPPAPGYSAAASLPPAGSSAFRRVAGSPGPGARAGWVPAVQPMVGPRGPNADRLAKAGVLVPFR